MKQSLRKYLLNGKSLTGTLLTIPSTEVAEILSNTGFDWLFIDLEHSSISLQTAQLIVQAASPQSYCVIRCPSNDKDILQDMQDGSTAIA